MGLVFKYSCSALLISFEIDCFQGLWTRVNEYEPPNYRPSAATVGLVLHLGLGTVGKLQYSKVISRLMACITFKGQDRF